MQEGEQVQTVNVATAIPLLPNSMKALLSSDDTVLDKLNRLAQETHVGGLDASSDQARGIVTQVRKLTIKLASLFTAIVRHRLDRTYLVALAEAGADDQPTNGLYPPEPEPHISVVKSDLESLDAEVPAVAKMSAEAEFLKPVVDEMEAKKEMLEAVVTGRGGYVLLLLNSRLLMCVLMVN